MIQRYSLKQFRKTLAVVLIVAFVITQLLLIKSHLKLYTNKFDPKSYRDIYYKSQYVVLNSKHVIPDETVFAFAGWEYINGANPILINGEAAPLGKYFIGIAEKYLNNERIIAPIFNILCLIALFFLSWLVLENIVWALLLVFLFSFEKIFIAQIIYAPLLDNIQLFFILLSFIFYIISLRRINYLLPAFLSLGALMSVKFWSPGVIIVLAWLAHSLLLKDYKRIFKLILFAPATLVSMLIIFIPVFAHGETPRRFFGYQKYLYEFYKVKLDLNPTGLWELLLFNRWHISLNSPIRQAADWQFSWPILTILSFLALISIVVSRKRLKIVKGPVGVVVLWFLLYSFFLSFGTILPRYILPIFPAMYLLAAWLLLVRNGMVYKSSRQLKK